MPTKLWIWLQSPPAAPQNLQLSGGMFDNPLLTWNANTEPDLWRYYIYRATNYTGIPPPLGSYNQIGWTTGTSFTDENVYIYYPNNWHWYYYVKARDVAYHYSPASNMVSTTGFTKRIPSDQTVTALPESFALHPAHPNPFNPSTTLRYDLPEVSSVNLIVYDLAGRELRRWSLRASAGFQQAVWDGRDQAGRPVPSGIYIYRLEATSTESPRHFAANRKMVLLK